jgi:cephalosporin hydroxylase
MHSSNLEWLAYLYGTDKGRRYQGGVGNDYMRYYATHLRRFRRRHPLTVLEIGIRSGASLRVWRDYFPRAKVAGIDIEPIEIDASRIVTFRGSQDDPAFLAEVVGAIGAPDIVIDDGSHIGRHINITFQCLFPTLAAHGLYVIEDTHTAYMPDYEGGPPGTPNTSATLVKSLIDSLHQPGDVGALHVYPRIAFIERS